MEMAGEFLDDPKVGFYGTLSVITTLEFLQHHSAKMGHRDLLVTHNLSSQSGNHISVHLTRSVRRTSGFVVCRACSAARRCKSSTQPDGGEGLLMTQGLSPRGRSEGSVKQMCESMNKNRI